MLNMDFSERVVLDSNELSWVSSPAEGVFRKPLARADNESGHATSIVKFEPGASFPQHDHPAGEEIFVLEGVFSDETGDYGPGSYFRNPKGFRHRSFSNEGCVIFVKLCQFQTGDSQHIHINTQESAWLPGQGNLQVMPLHTYKAEHTALVKWPADEEFHPHRHHGGEEILVISGEFIDEFGNYPAGSWIRSPDGSVHHPRVRQETVIWVKVGHL